MTISRGVRRVALLGAVLACHRDPRERVPDTNALVVTSDSTFWITSDTGGFHVRRSSILLARYNGRFYEVYVTDDDRSFYDAVIVGQRVFSRDIVTGDSLAVFEDPEVAMLASQYAAAHPRERPLGPDEDEAEHPSLVATTETEIVDVVGPYLTFEQSADLSRARAVDVHEAHRTVIDLRNGHSVSLVDLAPDSTVQRLLHDGRAAVKAAFDSVRRSRDTRAREASALLGDFVFNELSFSLVVMEDRAMPGVAFFVPGRGDRAGGYALPLPPLAFAGGTWWNEVRRSLPTEAVADTDMWSGATHELVATYGSAADAATLALRSRDGRVWPITRVPIPVDRVHWLDAPRDSVTLNALTRAFDEAELHTGDVRIAAQPMPRVRLVSRP